MDKFLIHHGIKGQRWGVRRFQNEDGTLTAAGKSKQKNKEKSSKDKKIIDKNKVAKIIGISSGMTLGAAGITAAAISGKAFLDGLGQGLTKGLLKYIFTVGDVFPI